MDQSKVGGETIKLTGGRKIVRRRVGNKVKINFLHSPDGVKIISDKNVKELKEQKLSSNKGSKKASKKPSKKAKIAGSTNSFRIQQIFDDPRHEKILRQQAGQNDITPIAPPYHVNTQQRAVLKHIVGSENEEQIERLNSLIHTGVINTTCPPTGRSELTEEYVDITNGLKQCKAPSKPRVALNSKSCPDEDPFAKEEYIDADGNTQCRRPVVRGEFQCPPSNNSAAKYHATLSDGTGVCLTTPVGEMTIEDLEISQNIFDHLVGVYPDDIQKRLHGLYNLFETNSFTQDEVNRLNRIFKTNKTRKTAVYDLLHDVKLKDKINWGKVLFTNDDIRIGNYALLHYIRVKYPSMLNKEAPSKTDKLRFLGVVKKGGKRKVRKGKKSAKKVSQKDGKQRKGKKSAKKASRKHKGGGLLGDAANALKEGLPDFVSDAASEAARKAQENVKKQLEDLKGKLNTITGGDEQEGGKRRKVRKVKKSVKKVSRKHEEDGKVRKGKKSAKKVSRKSKKSLKKKI